MTAEQQANWLLVNLPRLKDAHIASCSSATGVSSEQIDLNQLIEYSNSFARAGCRGRDRPAETSKLSNFSVDPDQLQGLISEFKSKYERHCRDSKKAPETRSRMFRKRKAWLKKRNAALQMMFYCNLYSPTTPNGNILYFYGVIESFIKCMRMIIVGSPRGVVRANTQLPKKWLRSETGHGCVYCVNP